MIKIKYYKITILILKTLKIHKMEKKFSYIFFTYRFIYVIHNIIISNCIMCISKNLSVMV